jgi:hypothetical protein
VQLVPALLFAIIAHYDYLIPPVCGKEQYSHSDAIDTTFMIGVHTYLYSSALLIWLAVVTTGVQNVINAWELLTAL